MQYHLILSERCNLVCKYCGGTRYIEGIPLDRNYDVDDLVTFFRKDPTPVIGFYGGEPLLALDFLYEVMDKINATFTLQTNGTFLDELNPSYLKRLDSILVSLDGGKTVTDYYRGLGTYDKLIENCRLIREKGFDGDLIARMAVSDKSDVFRDVMHLVNLENPKFDHVYWQLDVFWSEIKNRKNIESC